MGKMTEEAKMGKKMEAITRQQLVTTQQIEKT
jgi:hypothetical protein